MPPEVLLLYSIVLTIFGFIGFPFEDEYHSFQVCEEFCWDFDGHCIESVDCFWNDCHFYYVNSTYQRAWEIFTFSGIFFNFFLQGFKVPVIQVFHLLA